jgi:hypothetical protein
MSAAGYDVHQEEDEVRARRLTGVGLLAFLIGGVAVLFSSILLVAVTGALQPSFAGPSGPQPAPRELSNVAQTPIWDSRAGEDLLDRQRRELETWGWVDRKAGIANIPIERAMDLVVEESR